MGTYWPMMALLLCGCAGRELEEPKFETLGTADSQERSVESKILWLAGHGLIEEALEEAQRLSLAGVIRHEVLEELGLFILHDAMAHGDQNQQMLALIGAGIAQHERCVSLLLKGAHSDHPMVQMHALQALFTTGVEEADAELIHALGSPWIPVKLTAAQLLAAKRSPELLAQIEGLLKKLPPMAHPYLMPLLAQINSEASIGVLKHYLVSGALQTRISAIASVHLAGRDDLCEHLRALASHNIPAQSEAAAFVLGSMGDLSAKNILEHLLDSSESATRLAAAVGCIQLGADERWQLVESEALKGYPAAIQLLSTHPASIELLAGLVRHPDPNIRLNAALALLDARDPRGVDTIKPILLNDPPPFFIKPERSAGGVFHWYRVGLADAHEALPLHHAFCQHILEKLVELPEDLFLQLASEVLAARHAHLYPITIKLLENIHTPRALEMIHQQRQRPGEPLARILAIISLYRLGQPGPWEEALLQWVRTHHSQEMIRLSQAASWEDSAVNPSNYTMTPELTSQVMLETFEVLAAKGKKEALSMVLESMREGHPTNRPVLAGLLIRMAI